MNFNELIKEQQERNRKTWNDEHVVVGGLELITLDQLTQQTAEAVRDWAVEEIRPFVERVRLDVDVIICDCGEKYKDSDLDLSVGELEKEISQLQANKDLSGKE